MSKFGLIVCLCSLVAPLVHAEPKPKAAATKKAPKRAATRKGSTQPAPDCDLRKVDWKNFRFGELALRDGGWGGTDKEMKNVERTVELQKVDYMDLDKNGKQEAWALMTHSSSIDDGEGSYSNEVTSIVAVAELDESCVPKYLGAVEYITDYKAVRIKGDQIVAPTFAGQEVWAIRNGVLQQLNAKPTR